MSTRSGGREVGPRTEDRRPNWVRFVHGPPSSIHIEGEPTISTLLIVDPNGRRRVAFEAEAQLEDHKVYSAGTAEEALHEVGFYIPEVVVIAADLPDRTAIDLVKALRASDRATIRAIPVATPVSAAADAARPNAVLAKGAAPNALLAAALDAIRTATESTEGTEQVRPELQPATEEPANA